LICGFIAWVFVLGCVLLVIAVKNFNTVCVAAGEKVFFPTFVQLLYKNHDDSDFNSFSNDYFRLLNDIKVYGLNEQNINSVSNILASVQDKKITKSELESFSNSVWKRVTTGLSPSETNSPLTKGVSR